MSEVCEWEVAKEGEPNSVTGNGPITFDGFITTCDRVYFEDCEPPRDCPGCGKPIQIQEKEQ